ncbi:heavy metal translocating P-type ATPase [Atopomonas sediminilitoris]|uniref:heavy metal translocating P-type ATPase n=1 Tax=Atopomonas sediminilitoris TaxID=2919919 RepID=UPI001F4D83E5|nr:heavy metal translocating P-type ATPase [Atopomonas sediminilitoris]MCJ8169181.1 cadmium-translocating P-type ATPase [Atopomonas sediminilitoris]
MAHTGLCFHCDLPVPAGSPWQLEVLGQSRSFCCPGCHAVCQSIVAAGLDSYYQHRSEPSANPQDLPRIIQDELALLDRADVQHELVREDGTSRECLLLVEGITCAACGWLIERHLQQVAGVEQATLNLSNHRLSLRWQDDQIKLSQLLSEIRRIGYAAQPYQPDQAAQQLHNENRRALRQLGLAGLLWMQVMMASMATWPEFNIDLSADMHLILRWVSLFMTTPIVLYCCADFFKGALRDLRTRRLTMDVSVSLAIGVAYLAGIWTCISGQGELYFDAVGMFAFFLLAGRYLERRARERTASKTAELVNLLPASCLRVNADGLSERVLLRELQVNDQLEVLPGAIVPADGVVCQGSSSVDESLLTGEYLPVLRQCGDTVHAGTLNIEGPLHIRVSALGEASRLSTIVRLLERAQSEKPRLAELADRVAQYFLISVLLLSAVVAYVWWQIEPERALWIVIAVLVATCPCALSLATPTALTTATGTLHGLGLLLTRGHVLESLGQITTVVLDKTGTLTEGRLSLRQIIPLADLDAEACRALAAALEAHSEHPIARALGHSNLQASDMENHPGLGLAGHVGSHTLRIGQPHFVCALSKQAVPHISQDSGQWLLLGNQHGPLAWFVLDDQLRADAQDLIAALRQRHWRCELLSGDSGPMVAKLGSHLQLDVALGGQTPADKLAHVQALQQQGQRVLMLGDGVNDVPVLAAADISIAMGSATDLAKTSADAVLLSNRLSSVIASLHIAERTRQVIRQNLAWACLYNLLVLPLAATGWITPGWAALGMSVSSLLVVLNALRLSRAPAETSV